MGIKDKALAKFLLFWRDTKGMTATEYGLILAGITMGIMGTLFVLGEDLAAFFQALADRIDGMTP